MKSFRRRFWQVPQDQEATASAIQAASGASMVASYVLAARQMPVEQVSDFISPTLKKLLPNPASLLDMDKAVQTVRLAMDQNRSICIWGDYDVDGACSTAVLVRTLRAFGSTPRFRIPDRLTEGYGPNGPALRQLREEGVDLVIVADAGTTAFEPLQVAAEVGLEVVVLDHHAAESVLPLAKAVVNPNRQDQAPGMGHLCAAAVCFLFAVALVADYRSSGRSNLPDLKKLLDLVGLATVADVMPLQGINRAFVRLGLKLMNQNNNPGITSLLEVAGIDREKKEVSAYHCGYVIGPRINAGGRVGNAEIGAQLLIEDDVEQAKIYASMLHAWNVERKTIEDHCQQEALSHVAQGDVLAFAFGDGWHEGVIGIVAGRLKEAFDAPAFVFAKTEEGEWKGSGRSVPGFDLGAAVMEARQLGLLVKGGGHAMAAGATAPAEGLPAFKAFLEEKIRARGSAVGERTLSVDLVILPQFVSEAIVDQSHELAPFGTGNPEPLVMLPEMTVASVNFLKNKAGDDRHLQVWLQSGSHRLKAMAFNAANTPLSEQMVLAVGKKVDVLGAITLNEWKERVSVEFRLIDARLSQGS